MKYVKNCIKVGMVRSELPQGTYSVHSTFYKIFNKNSKKF